MPAPAAAAEQRIDKWLWCARFFKSRTLAAKACHDGRIRVSGQASAKAHQAVRVGDVLTFPLGPNIRVVRVMALAMRRGPPAEARSLYQELAPSGSALSASVAVDRHETGAGRPGDGGQGGPAEAGRNR
jgi:ribosome-associated heat shock protein Hsp15